MKKRLTLVTTVCGRFFYFYEKNVWLCNQLLMTEGQSYSTSASYVTWPSTWHLRGLNLPSSFQTESYLCHLSKSRIYTTFYLREILIATRYYFIILVCWALKWLISNNNRQKTNLVNMDASYVNYFTVPLQSYSPSLSSESLTQVRPLGLLHASSSAMPKHPPVQASPASPHECLVVWLL